jgi:two-component sensor histidine kinase
LSTDAGGVRVAWSIAPVEGSGELQLTWMEEGGPPVVPPSKTGFGTRLIRRGLAHDFGSDAIIDFRPAGVVSIIKVPLQPGTM